MPELNEAVIVATARSPIGRANKGSLVDVRADELMATILNALMDKVPEVDKSDVFDIICGNVAQQGETGFSIARTAGLLAGFPYSVPGLTLNRFCSSSLQSIRSAAHAIGAGEGHAYIAAGVEKSSRPPGRRGRGARRGPAGGASGRAASTPSSWAATSAFPNVYIPMGLTAENVAEKFKVSARGPGRLRQAEPGPRRGRPGRRVLRPRDHARSPRRTAPSSRRTTARGRAPRSRSWPSWHPSFKPEGGTVTAGNACPLNDGAAAVMVMSRARADELGLRPLARIVASAVSGNDPEIMGVAPIDAIPKALAQAGMKLEDVDILELNEAFAAQVLPVCRETGIDIEHQLNPHGGAIALGHPFGMTGRPDHDHAHQRPPDRGQVHRPRDHVRRRRHGHGHGHRAAGLSRILRAGGGGPWATSSCSWNAGSTSRSSRSSGPRS